MVREIDLDPEEREIEKALLRMGLSTAVPAVFICGKFMVLHLSGSLVQMLNHTRLCPELGLMYHVKE
ncbi:hypothetical protein FRX31_006071 [Thalictrum thalictroides]|uniref:Uncharacterized protein n=1 Tax=Thalictrum thalictroides TaxID=46969 RepID=A0A7J6X7K5_THATH|nr:hypothetical protein FRX31_006071 [Thalictrum thalictroides]